MSTAIIKLDAVRRGRSDPSAAVFAMREQARAIEKAAKLQRLSRYDVVRLSEAAAFLRRYAEAME